MALTDKNIIITPNIGQNADPKIAFSGANTSIGAQTINLNVYPNDGGTISFEGSSGQLFSITNKLTGTIFSVNDISGIPSIEVLDTGLVKIAQYSGNVQIGSTSSSLKTYGTASLGLSTGSESLRVTPVASAVNYVNITGNPTGYAPQIKADGSDANVGFSFITKGNAGYSFYTNAGTPQFAINHTASAVNYLQVTGAGTGVNPIFSVQGSDANINIAYSTKGTGSHGFYTATSTPQFAVTHTASAVNYLAVTGAVTTGYPLLAAVGSDPNIGLSYSSKGAAGHLFYGNSSLQFVVGANASSVNYLQVAGSVTGIRTNINAQGSDTNVGINYITKGAEGHAFFSNGGSAIQLYVSPTASAVNYLQVTGAVTGTAPTISAQGSDTNIDFAITPKGTGKVKLGAVGSVSITGGSSGQLLTTDGSGNLSFTTVGGFSSTDDTTTNATYYPVIATTAGGSTAKTSSTKLNFNPSTGTLSATIFNSLSDATKKKNVVQIQNASEVINKIDGVEFDWIDNNQKSAGVIAQELEKILPHLVSESDGTKSVNYSGIIAYLIESNKELQKRIEMLENK